jgi:HlyD family secretion protein
MRLTVTIDGVSVNIDADEKASAMNNSPPPQPTGSAPNEQKPDRGEAPASATKSQTDQISGSAVTPAPAPAPADAATTTKADGADGKAAAAANPNDATASKVGAPAAKDAGKQKSENASADEAKPGQKRKIVMITLAVGVLLIAALAIAAYATNGFGLLGRHEPKELILNGNVDIRQVDLGFRVAGRIESIPFEEGAHVTAGAVLAILDKKPLQDQLAVNEAGLASSSALLDKQRNGNRAQEIAQAAAKLADMNALLARAKEDFDRRSGLVSSGAISQSDFESSRSQFLSAQAQAESAEQSLSLQRAGFRKEDIAAAVAQRDQAVALRDKSVTDLADSDLRAPNAGVLLTRAREPGAIVAAGETVLTLTMDRPMRVRAYVDESNLGRISPGMAVEVTTDSSAKTYHGSIGHISPTAEFTPKTVQTQDLRTNLVYSLRVIVDDPDDSLRQGQPVTIRVSPARPGASTRSGPGQ